MCILQNTLFDNHIYISNAQPIHMDISLNIFPTLYGCFSDVQILHMAARCRRGLTDVVT